MELILGFLSEYGYLALFFLLLLSGTYVPIPAGIILIFIGAFSHGRPLHLIISFSIAVIASLISTLSVYAIGRKLGQKDVYDRFVNRNRIGVRLEKFMTRHPRAAILVSRFIGFASMPVNAMAGSMQINLRTFIPYAVLGEALCTIAYLAAGYFIGANWETDAKTAGRIISGIFLGIGFVSLAWFYISHRRKQARA